MKFQPHHVFVPFSCGEVYVFWEALIHPKDIVVVQARMYVDMHVWHFLKRGFTDGMPKADAVVWKCMTHGARDL